MLGAQSYVPSRCVQPIAASSHLSQGQVRYYVVNANKKKIAVAQ
jgi:hypothetical protein